MAVLDISLSSLARLVVLAVIVLTVLAVIVLAVVILAVVVLAVVILAVTANYQNMSNCEMRWYDTLTRLVTTIAVTHSMVNTACGVSAALMCTLCHPHCSSLLHCLCLTCTLHSASWILEGGSRQGGQPSNLEMLNLE